MKRLSREEYARARNCLKRYNYNCINIMNVQSDILSLSVAPSNGLPRVPYAIGNSTLNKVIQLDENESLQTSIKEYKVVIQALNLLNDKVINEIFKEEYQKRRK